MAANAPIPCTVGAVSPSPYRQRKHVTCVPTLATLSEAAVWIERTGQRARVQRWLTTLRVLEEFGLPCESLDELDRDDEVVEPSQDTGEAQQLAQLQALVGQTAAVSARIGAGVDDVELRTLCFALSRACHRAQSKMRGLQLWSAQR